MWTIKFFFSRRIPLSWPLFSNPLFPFKNSFKKASPIAGYQITQLIFFHRCFFLSLQFVAYLSSEQENILQFRFRCFRFLLYVNMFYVATLVRDPGKFEKKKSNTHTSTRTHINTSNSWNNCPSTIILPNINSLSLLIIILLQLRERKRVWGTMCVITIDLCIHPSTANERTTERQTLNIHHIA